jgi:hypothetical protein
MSVRFAPGAKVRSVESDTKNVCRDEAVLGGAQADHTN